MVEGRQMTLWVKRRWYCFIRTHLENQLVWVDTIRQAEGRAQVPFHLRYFLDEGQELSINSFLVRLPLLCQLVLLKMDKKKTTIRSENNWETCVKGCVVR